ncbi:DNA cytosine methyltransferase [Agrobacterium sp.]|uniref:DNA cytosine methyltransferase n=1 Tax=Agrobacterium sp. TaxID=361 RepID=UPI0028AC2372|nr:DNA cytosine methyltransferase [Agrobacterium sp.]
MRELKVVDLFCGAGGITCGFEGAETRLSFKTVLGLDIDQSAISIYNDNFGRRGATEKVQVGRKVDLNWFAHPTEIRLFYLAHLAYSGQDARLEKELSDIGLNEFLAELALCDEKFSAEFSKMSNDADYKVCVSDILQRTDATALTKAFMNKLGLSSLTSPRPATAQLPWCEEYQNVEKRSFALASKIDADILGSFQELWDSKVKELLEASQKAGRGKLKGNAAKVANVAQFLLSSQGVKLGHIWMNWRATRETIRANFCVRRREQIDLLYTGERRVDIVLGGPPCKGFSRIGRPVIQSLRNQGVHAWSHREYGDERNALMCQYVLFLDALRPDAFLFENVANFQSALKTPNGVLDAPSLLVELIDAISDGAHYAIKHKVLNARNFGVPQDRRRFIMFGVRGAGSTSKKVLDSFFDLPVYGDDVALAVALDGLAPAMPFQSGARSEGKVSVYPRIDERMPPAEYRYRLWTSAPHPVTRERSYTTTGHIYRTGRDDDRAFVEYVAPGIRWMDLKPSKAPTLKKAQQLLQTLQAKTQDKNDRESLHWLHSIMDESLVLRLLLEHNQLAKGLEEQHLLLEGYLKNGASMHGDWFERLSASKPSKTIVAHIGKDTYGYWHPFEARSISIREAARIQSFPDWFRIAGVGVVDAYTAIGNAVPPLMAQMFAARLCDLDGIFGIFSDREANRLAAAE